MPCVQNLLMPHLRSSNSRLQSSHALRNLILILAATGGPAWSQSDHARSVSFLVIDESGSPLSGWHVSSFKAGSRELAEQFKDLEGTQIPYGLYKYVLTRSPAPLSGWVPNLGGSVEIFRTEKLFVLTASTEVLIGLAFDFRLPSSFVIKGRIEPAPALPEGLGLRIQIHPVNSGPDVNVSVDQSGDFRIYDALRGLCVLTLLRGSELLAIKPVIFDQGLSSTSFVLSLADKSISATRVH